MKFLLKKKACKVPLVHHLGVTIPQLTCSSTKSLANCIVFENTLVNTTEGVMKKSLLHCCYCTNIVIQHMVATISGMFKIGGSAKKVFSSLLLTQLCKTGNFCSRQFVDYVS